MTYAAPRVAETYTLPAYGRTVRSRPARASGRAQVPALYDGMSPQNPYERSFAGGEVRCRAGITPEERFMTAVDAHGSTADVVSMRPLLQPGSLAVIGAGRSLKQPLPPPAGTRHRPPRLPSPTALAGGLLRPLLHFCDLQ